MRNSVVEGTSAATHCRDAQTGPHDRERGEDREGCTRPVQSEDCGCVKSCRNAKCSTGTHRWLIAQCQCRRRLHSRGACLFPRDDQRCEPRWYPRVEVEEESSGVNAQRREHTHQGGVCPQAKLMRNWKPSSRRVSQQPVGRVGRAPEEQSHRRDDQAVVRASENVTVSSPRRHKPGQREAFTRTRRQQCKELSSNIVNTMTVSDEVNKIETVLNNPLQFKIQVGTCSTERTKHHHNL